MDARSRDELTAVCTTEYPRLVGLLMLQVGDRPVAEELAQDALTALSRNWEQVDSPQAWLTRVALNRANSWLRRRIAERRAHARHGPSPVRLEDSTEQHAEADEVRRLVAALPRRQRMAVALRFYERYSVAETAQLMGCAEGTVKALTHQAVARLRSSLTHEREYQHG